MKTFNTIFAFVLLLTVLSTDKTFSQDFWSKIGLDSVRVESMAANSDGIIFAGTDDYPNAESLYRSTDNGLTWTPSDTGMNFAAPIYNIAAGPDGYMYADSYRSSDYGHSWEYLPGGSVLNIKEIVVAFNGAVYYCSSSNGLLKSENHGDTLINISDGLGTTNIHSFLPAVNGYLYCGTNSDLYRSTDEGTTWTAMGLGLAPRVDALAEIDNGKIIACTSSGIYVSIDSGNSWAYKYGSGSFTSIAANSNGKIYVGVQNNGIIRSSDGGDTWDWFNDGITNFYVEPVIINNGFVFAGTRGGIFRGEEVTAVNNNRGEIPYKFQLHQNYPNPFNPATTITYSIPKEGFINLSVFNALGQKVATLVNENKSAGNYNIVFNAGRLTSGIYYYRLTSGGFSSVKKMILLK